jgi:hypothetical protein
MGATTDPSTSPAASTIKRVRPLIYVYNGPLEVNSQILQYREWKKTCVWRSWYLSDKQNATELVQDNYNLEALLPDLLMGSLHRTLVPEEADYFFVPVLPACYLAQVAAQHDFPWFYRPT